MNFWTVNNVFYNIATITMRGLSCTKLRLLLLLLVALVFIIWVNVESRTKIVRGTFHIKEEISKDNVIHEIHKKFNEDKNDFSVKKASSKKLILLYTTMFGTEQWSDITEARSKRLLEENCAVKDCVVTYDKRSIKEAAAVIFHGKDVKTPIEYLGLLLNKQPDQLWAWLSSETPQSAPFKPVAAIKGTDTMFNLTITYQRTSDIPIPYAKYGKYKQGDIIPKLKDNYAEGKTKMVAWMISNCAPYPRRRNAELLLNLGIKIDITGLCAQWFPGYGLLNCSRNCSAILPQYKFFFAAENIVCKDYVTEKYWRYPFQYNMIPIVLAADDNTMIPGSYISIDQFHTAKELAEHLRLLDNDDALFNKYFEWRKKYYVIENGWFPFASIFLCDLCRMVHVEPITQRIIKMSEVWNETIECDSNTQHSNYLLDIYRKVTANRTVIV